MGWDGMGGHTHADDPRRNTLTALLCSFVCCGQRWDLVGHNVALQVPDKRLPPLHSPECSPAYYRATGEREAGQTATDTVSNQRDWQMKSDVLEIHRLGVS